ncbi:GMC family oxidoreductase [Advenella mimigardefordensis]|uniref:Putative glucose-methanol-choline oxidoreductase n=1 Tax=Advenella mimigardefordensis (strain DSM 17166 / LMG 22922 / DPN7) TaxID=1247726 RepID=W0PJJ4_ADVMD|nr:choline dehydrogenase [Advenella mimigardefordensis]AHG65710.1 putative glucose-methanol-choline oxidoreductase [Advenella mimigardefordensis DPN7]
MLESVDYVVVGGGSAGCVMANRLSENGKYSVCLLEAGPADRNLWIHIPIGYGKTMFNPRLNWGFYTDPDHNMLDRRIYWPRGKTLGGSSSINGLIYIRGQKEDYDHWEALGNPGWSWEACLPYFRKLENNDLGAGPTHGTEGPLNATSIPKRHELVDALIGAANSLGIPTRKDFNTGDQRGVGYYQLTTRNGRRCSTAVAYLNPARQRPNLRIETEAQAMKILFRGKKATGVQYRQHGKIKTLNVNREVILCSGALQSPQLLQLSGIGNPDHLSPLGIPVVHTLNGVGENLQDHLQFRLIYEVNKPITTNDLLRSWSGRAKMGLQWALLRGGPLAIGINQGALFCNALSESDARPDVQFHFGTLSADMAGGQVHDFSGCTFSVCQLRPESRGYLRIRSTDPFEAPAMQPNYLSTDLDRRTAIAGVRLTRKLADAPPLQSLMKGEVKPGRDVRSDDEILHFCRENGATIFHPSGTAKMGPADDPMAVVDHRLAVRGLQGLRVVDASIMPALVSGNTNVPVVMVAERAAAFVLEDAQAGEHAFGVEVPALAGLKEGSVEHPTVAASLQDD